MTSRMPSRRPGSAAPTKGATARPAAVELRIAGSALRFMALLALPTLGVAWFAAGREGLNGALVGAAVVAGMFAVAAGLSALAAPHGPTALFTAVLGGFALRLGAYAALIVWLRPVEAIHGPSLAISAAVLLMSTLAYEAWHVSRTPQFFWIDASAAIRPQDRGPDPELPLRAPAPERTSQ